MPKKYIAKEKVESIKIDNSKNKKEIKQEKTQVTSNKK